MEHVLLFTPGQAAPLYLTIYMKDHRGLEKLVGAEGKKTYIWSLQPPHPHASGLQGTSPHLFLGSHHFGCRHPDSGRIFLYPGLGRGHGHSPETAPAEYWAVSRFSILSLQCRSEHPTSTMGLFSVTPFLETASEAG